MSWSSPMRSLFVVFAALALATWAPQAATALSFVVTRGPMTPMDPTAEHRVLEQLWTVDRPGDGNSDNTRESGLEALTVSIPGRVFVSVGNNEKEAQDGQSIATVRVSGNAEGLFELFEVVSLAPGAIEIRQRPGARVRLVDTYALVEVTVAQREQLERIVSKGSADLVVEDGVLVADAPGRDVHVQVAGSGDVFLASTAAMTRVAGITIDVSGSGDLVWTAGSLDTHHLAMNLAGSGDVHLTAASRLAALSTRVSMWGSSDVRVESPELTSTTVSIAIAGSGDVTLRSPRGSCTVEDIAIAGSGDVDTGDVVCGQVKLAIAGSGDVLVAASDAITGKLWGSGRVKYVGPRPRQISDRHLDGVYSSADNHHYKPIAKPKSARHRPAPPSRMPTPPARVATAVIPSVGLPVGLTPLVILALISACYLRGELRRHRRRRGPYSAESQRLLHDEQRQQQSQVYV